jgi:hypothetical protein
MKTRLILIAALFPALLPMARAEEPSEPANEKVFNVAKVYIDNFLKHPHDATYEKWRVEKKEGTPEDKLPKTFYMVNCLVKAPNDLGVSLTHDASAFLLPPRQPENPTDKWKLYALNYDGETIYSDTDTPEEKAAKEQLAKEKAATAAENLARHKALHSHTSAKADREALAITPANTALRVWHKGKDPVASKGKTYHPTHKAPTTTPIQGKLIKIYPDIVILEKKDQSTIEIARKDLVKADRAYIENLAK